MIAAVAFHYDDAVVSYAPRCEYGDCDAADLRNGLCSTHGIDCRDCGARFDVWDVADGLCHDCAPSDRDLFVLERRVGDDWSRIIGGFATSDGAREWATHRNGGALRSGEERVTWRVGADSLAVDIAEALAS